LIKLDKPDFVGRPELCWQAGRSDFPRLVGVAPEDRAVVPPEASQIVAEGRIVGRITSSRMSPTLGRSICLAQVSSGFAPAGTRITVRLPDGRDVDAVVTGLDAPVDPSGSRQRV
jgi:sarcosine oxidase subunit alpha